MNTDHREALRLYGTVLLGRRGKHWSMVGIDPDGLDLRCGHTIHRLDFGAPVDSAETCREVLVALQKRRGKNPAGCPRIGHDRLLVSRRGVTVFCERPALDRQAIHLRDTIDRPKAAAPKGTTGEKYDRYRHHRTTNAKLMVWVEEMAGLAGPTGFSGVTAPRRSIGSSSIRCWSPVR